MARVYQELEQALPGLSKAVYSQPVDALSAPKVTVRPVTVKGGLCYQIETFRDNKAYHKNVEAEELLPQTRQTRPAVRRMHRALQEAEELYLAAGDQQGPETPEATDAEPVSA